MPKATTTKETKKVKKEVEKNVDLKIDKEEIKKKLKMASDEVVEKVNWIKKKFNDADPSTKKKIVASLSAAAAGLVVLTGIAKHKNKK